MTIYELAEKWLVDDPNPQTREQLYFLIAAAKSGDIEALAELTDAFSGPLTFGTAGLRAAMAPGPNRMNSSVVRRASSGLARFTLDNGGTRAIVGFDARRNSEQFAHDTAAVMSAAGLAVEVLPRPLPTPVLAFAVRQRKADVGVMITASHNPASDNGYKVYLGTGSQIVAPIDAHIAREIAHVGPARSIPVGDGWVTLDDHVVDSYLEVAATLYSEQVPRNVQVAYTPLHGVGGQIFVQACQRVGLPAPIVVAAQFEPDPEFPTVDFPNPEEPGAMDLVLGLANDLAADVAIAHDPDADRCAVAVARAGRYQMLRGDDVGALLAWWAIERARRNFGPVLSGTMATSIVSSSLLELIAGAAGLGYECTLTGFKYLGAVDSLVYAYEEALGYCVDPQHVRDKDGITAALRIIELVAFLKEQGRTVDDALADLAREFGVHLTEQVSIRMSTISHVSTAMSAARANPPTALAGYALVDVTDLANGSNDLPATDALVWRLPVGRVIVRPSGTEPKLKAYLELVFEPHRDVESAYAQASAVMATLSADVNEFLRSI